MPNRRSSLSSSSSSAYSSSPSKSPPVKTPTTSRRRRRATEPSTTSSSSAKSRRRRRRRRRAAEPSSTSTTPTESRRRRRKRAAKPSSTSSSPQSSSPSNSPPGKRGAKKVRSQQKLHSIVVCEHEKKDAKDLMSIRTKKLILYARPIGQVVPVKAVENSTTAKKEGSTTAKEGSKTSKNEDSTAKKDSNKPKKEPELQNFGCNVLRAIERFVRLLHSLNLTLEGKLNVNMLCWIGSSNSVKLRKIPNLEKYTDEGARKDYRSIGTSIWQDLFIGKGQKPPADVLAWIDLMAHPFRHKYLLRYNTALLNPRAKLDHFLSLYEKLLQVRMLALVKDKASEKQYVAVLKKIPVGASVWTKSVSKNEYVQKVYNKNIAGRSDSVFELLKLVRDCIYHLMDYSVEDGVVKFCADDKYLMIETCFPGVFCQFQRAMADEGFEDACLKEGQGM